MTDRRDFPPDAWWDSLDEDTMTATVTLWEGDTEEEVEVPFVWAVCLTCRGAGSHVNPSIDAHGITAEEWAQDWDDESREQYRRGGYNVSCHECHGRRVVPELSPACPAEITARIEAKADELASLQAMEAAERRYGA